MSYRGTANYMKDEGDSRRAPGQRWVSVKGCTGQARDNVRCRLSKSGRPECATLERIQRRRGASTRRVMITVRAKTRFQTGGCQRRVQRGEPERENDIIRRKKNEHGKAEKKRDLTFGNAASTYVGFPEERKIGGKTGSWGLTTVRRSSNA